jgi:hypothetical protein
LTLPRSELGLLYWLTPLEKKFSVFMRKETPRKIHLGNLSQIEKPIGDCQNRDSVKNRLSE